MERWKRIKAALPLAGFILLGVGGTALLFWLVLSGHIHGTCRSPTIGSVILLGCL